MHAQSWTSTHLITYFRGNKAGAVSFTFDDGYPSQAFTAAAELTARGVNGTFFIITDLIQHPWYTPWPTWATWQNAAAQGHEIASHTATHPSLSTLSEEDVRWELATSQSVINQNISGQSAITIAYPYADSNNLVEAISAEYYVASRVAWADEGGCLNYYQSGLGPYGPFSTVNFNHVGSMQMDGLTTSDPEFNSRLDRAALYHAWLPLMYHDVPDAAIFGSTIDYILGKQDYWIDTFGNVSRYMKERLNSTIEVVTDSPSEIKLRVAMDASLSATIYNVPLTIRSTVPSSWTRVIVEQGNSTQILTPMVENSEKVIYYNTLPNGGDIVLIPANPAPELTSLYPVTSFVGGSSFTLTVTGADFINGSIVRWNNLDRATTYISPTQLTVLIPASDIASVGIANVRVFNPAPGGGVSGKLPFSTTTRPVTVTVTPGQSKVYGDADPIFTYTSSDPAAIFTGSLTRVPGEDAGAYAINQGTLAVPSGNYTLTFIPANFTITPKNASVIPNAASKVFGSADPSFTGTLAGFLPADIVTATYQRTAGEIVAGSPYTISATLNPADTLDNYNITYGTANFVITPANAIVALSDLNHIYDGTHKSAVTTTNPPGLPVNITYNGSSTVPIDAGSYTVAATVNHPNYTGVASGRLFIARATVVPDITVNNKTYDGTTGATIVSRNLSGVIGEDVVSLLGGTASFVDKNVANGKPVTVTGLTLSGTDAGNYQLSSTSAHATANVGPRTLSVTASGVDKIYDGTSFATVTLSDDRIGGDNVKTGYTSASFLGPNASSGKTINVGGISITGGTDANNYVLGNTTAIANANITAMDQTITVTKPAPVTASEGKNFDVVATALSGLPVAITTSGGCAGGGGGTATIIMTSDRGVCSIFYNQSGDMNHNSAVQIQEDVLAIQKPAISVNIPAPSVTGQTVAVTVTVTGASGVPTGTVTVTGADTNCAIALTDGIGSCNVLFNFPGTRTIATSYSGDATYAASAKTDAYQVNPAQIAKDGGFNIYSRTSKIPLYWEKSATFLPTDGKDETIRKEGTASIKLIGNGTTKTLMQTLSVSGVAGQPFVFSYWVKASAMPTTGLCQGQVLFYDGTTLKGTTTLKCPLGTTYSWKNTALSFTSPAAYSKVVIKFTYSKSSGTVWFDLASLVR